MNESFDKIKTRLTIKSARVQAFMASEIGKEIIQMLEDEFYHGDLYDPCPHKTAYNLGRRDVVVFLRELQNWRKIDE